MAYKFALPACARCGRPAVYEIRTSRNAALGSACARCADSMVREYEAQERPPCRRCGRLLPAGRLFVSDDSAGYCSQRCARARMREERDHG